MCDGGHLPTATQEEIQTAAEAAVDDGTAASLGEALFNLDLASGAYSCARCHTPGWSYGDPGTPGSGSLGWNLTGGATVEHFPNKQDMIDFIKAGSVNGARYGVQGQGSGKMPGFGATAHRRADRCHRGLREDSVTMTSLATLAIGWMPEIRGVLTVIIAVVVFCGSIYLLLATNVGARLGFLLSIAALAAWMASMGAIWWAYGLGPQGSRAEVGGRGGCEPDAHARPARPIRTSSTTGQLEIDDALTFERGRAAARESFRIRRVATSSGRTTRSAARRSPPPTRSSRTSSSSTRPVSTSRSTVLDRGGERSPNWFGDSFDFFALRHTPHYAIVEIAPVVPQRTEPGRAPATPVIDGPARTSTC